MPVIDPTGGDRIGMRPWLAWLAWLACATLLFARPLVRLMVYAWNSSLHSHIGLVPLVTGYLLVTDRRERPASRCSWIGATVLGGLALAVMGAGLVWGAVLSVNDDLAVMAFCYVCVVVAGACLFLGAQWTRANAFPLAFLIFMVPLPDAVVTWLETASKLASAEAAALYFGAVGTALVRHGTVFELPGITLQVAQECSGIRSSWVLVITSLLASYLFLKTPWRRAALVLFGIPLGVIRNGFRIFVIGELCVHVDPQIINSPLHHRGGPIFFALSLIPFFAVALWLQRRERRNCDSRRPAARPVPGADRD